jgi:hypothetical protein
MERKGKSDDLAQIRKIEIHDEKFNTISIKFAYDLVSKLKEELETCVMKLIYFSQL